jgi:hypothetical protein
LSSFSSNGEKRACNNIYICKKLQKDPVRHGSAFTGSNHHAFLKYLKKLFTYICCSTLTMFVLYVVDISTLQCCKSCKSRNQLRVEKEYTLLKYIEIIMKHLKLNGRVSVVRRPRGKLLL